MNKPKARIENIVIQEMNSEILIYDLKDNKAFCLNETSAIIYQLCDGKRTFADINEALSKKLNQPVNDELIWLALDGLKKEGLLESNEIEIDFNGLNRRQIIRKVGLASMVTLPVIASVIAPSGAMAASCVGVFQPCTGEMSSGNCCQGVAYCLVGTCRECFQSNQLNCNFSNLNSQASCDNFVAFRCCSGSVTYDPNNSFCQQMFGVTDACVCN